MGTRTGIWILVQAVAVGGCMMEVEGVADESADAHEEVGRITAPLNGEVHFPGAVGQEGYCNPAEREQIRRAVSMAASVVLGPARDDLLSCMRNSVVTMTEGGFPELVLEQLSENMPTVAKCADLEDALAEGPIGMPEEMTFDRTFLADPCGEAGASVTFGNMCPDNSQVTNDILVAGTTLHELAHNKGYRHPNDANQYYEFGQTWPSVLHHCVQALFWDWTEETATGTEYFTRGWPRHRMHPRAVLAPIGGTGGNAEVRYDACPGSDAGRGVQVRADSSKMYSVRLRCGSKNGGGTTSQTPARGGSGGSKQTFNCGGSYLMVGVRGYANDEIRGLKPLCERISTIQNGDRRTSWSTSFSPVPAGTAFDSICPAGEVVKAIKVSYGNRVDNIQLVCQEWGDSTPMYTTQTSTLGTKTGPTQEEICPNGGVMTGLVGSGADLGVLERLGALCIGINGSATSGQPDAMIPPHGGFNWPTPAFTSYWCGANRAMVGLETYSDVFGVRALCATSISGWRSGSNTTIDPMPSHGFFVESAADQEVCPTGQFMNGWKISIGDDDNSPSARVRGIKPSCAAL